MDSEGLDDDIVIDLWGLIVFYFYRPVINIVQK